MKKNYMMAGIVVSITSKYAYIDNMCKDYETNRTSIFEVEINDNIINHERKRESMLSVNERFDLFPDEYMEFLATYREIAEKMPLFDTILFHGSCISVDGNAYLFTAKSGTGKSTHARLWRELLGERAVMINDDKPLIKICEDGVLAYGTPWNGKHRLGNNMSAPLGAICIIKRATENAIREIGYEEAYPMLMQQCYRPSDREAMERTLELLDRMAKLLRFYELRCNISEEAARLSYGTMSGNLGGIDE